MKYDFKNKNYGKDFIYVSRLKLAKKLGIDIYGKFKTSSMYHYINEAKLGIILQ